MITVYTALFGDVTRDRLQPPPLGSKADYVCFSDQALTIPGWDVRQVARPDASPVLSARLCKLRPDLWIGPHATTIWLDASCMLTVPAEEIVALASAPVMGFRHPRRSALINEAEVIVQRGNADPDAVRHQMEAYYADGFPIDTHAVTTTGLLVRSPKAADFNRAWETEVRTHTWRDQLSVDYVGWKTRTAIGWLRGSYLDNAYMHYFRHVGSEKAMIWRDDDVLWEDYPLSQLLEVDDLFQREGLRHTVAILASTLTPTVARAIVDRGMAVQLHGWKHDDLSVDVQAIAELPQALRVIEDLVGVRPTVLYPPWNRTSPLLYSAASDLGLKISAEKVSLDCYIRKRGRVKQDTINFHYWAPEVSLLQAAFPFDASPRRVVACV